MPACPGTGHELEAAPGLARRLGRADGDEARSRPVRQIDPAAWSRCRSTAGESACTSSSPDWPLPGIEPRMPTVSGWSEGLHTSIVAHSWVDWAGDAAVLATSVFARAEDAGCAERGSRQQQERARPRGADGSVLASVTALEDSVARGACTDAPVELSACDIPARWPGSRSAEVVELLGRVPVFSTLVHGDLERIAEPVGAAPVRAGRGGVPRGRRERHLLRRARGSRARHPRARRRAHDHARDASDRATSSASWRCSRTSSARPPSRRSSRRAWWRCSVRTCAG